MFKKLIIASIVAIAFSAQAETSCPKAQELYNALKANLEKYSKHPIYDLMKRDSEKHFKNAEAMCAEESRTPEEKAAILAERAKWPQEIKGIHVGMSKAEFEQATAIMPFRIANIITKYDTLPQHANFKDDKLVSYIFFFDSSNFPDMLSALKEKYPQLQCKTEAVQNAMGAQYTGMDCVYGTLQLNKYVSDVNTSAISLTDLTNAVEEAKKNKQKQIGDL